MEREVKSPQEKTKKVPQENMRLTRGFTDRSDVYGSVGNDRCEVGVSGKDLGV